MPVKIGTFLKDLATKFGGIDISKPEYENALANEVELPDDLARAIISAPLMTEESAKNNANLKKHFTALALNGGDSRISSIMEELAFPDEHKNEITGIANTYDKITLLAKKAFEIGNQKAAATGKEKESLTTQYNTLQQQIADLKKQNETALAEKDKEFQNKIQQYILRNKMATRKLDITRFNAETMTDLAFGFLNKAMAEKGIIITNDNDVLKLKQAQDPGLDFYVNNEVYSVDAFIDEVLANNNLLAVNDQPPAGGNNGNLHNYTPNTKSVGGNAKPLNGMRSSLDKALADFTKSSGGVV